jgi:hypothetical protein
MPDPEVARADRPPRRFSGTSLAMPILAVILLFAVVAAFYYIGQFYSPGSSQGGQAQNNRPAAQQHQQHAAKNGAPSPSGKGKAAGGGSRHEQTRRTNTLKARLTVDGGPSWLEIKTDGNVVFVQTAEPGFSKTFTAKHEISITSGNAGAVKVRINGQDYGTLGDMGQVMTRTFTLKQAKSS